MTQHRLCPGSGVPRQPGYPCPAGGAGRQTAPDEAVSPAATPSAPIGMSPLTDRDWLRGWAAVLAVVAAMVGGALLLFNLVLCGCRTNPPV